MAIKKDIPLLLLQAGDKKAFEDLYHQYFRYLCYEARGYISDHSVIEELVNDVFVRFWRQCGQLDANTAVRPYLTTSIHHACISYMRHLAAFKAMQKELDRQLATDNTLYALGEDPLDYIITKELEENIEKAIGELPPQYRKAFCLSRFDDFSYQEIAQQMGISVNTVKTYMKNALLQLRKTLKYNHIFIFF